MFENAANGTLDDFVKFCKNRIGEDLVKIQFAQMINFIEFLQVNNIMHRDLKPGNIMLDEYYNIKIIDFGDAKEVEKLADKDTRISVSMKKEPIPADQEELADSDGLDDFEFDDGPDEEDSLEDDEDAPRVRADTFVGTVNY